MEPSRSDRLGWQAHVMVFLSAFALVVLRWPDAILHPQFVVEDGTLWYADAYNLGTIRSLFIPVVGYFQTISRLVGGFAQLFPILWAPLVFNVVAIIIQILPVSLMISSRFSAVIPDLRTRFFLSVLYLALPNSWDVQASLTNTQWRLALLAFMVLIARPRGSIWVFIDIGLLIVAGLSGPFSLFLAPLAGVWWYFHKDKRNLYAFFAVGICALVQGLALILAGGNRSAMALGATPELFARILSGHIFLGTLVGAKGYAWAVSHSLLKGDMLWSVTAVGLTFFLYALLKAPVELKLFIAFAVMIFAAALIKPQVSLTSPQWEQMVPPASTQRYWFIPIVGFVTVLVWMLGRSRPFLLRGIAMLAFSTMIIGITLDWDHPHYAQFDLKKHVKMFEAAPQGTQVTIPIFPPGWSMTLIKH